MQFRSFLSATLVVVLGLEFPALAQEPQAGPPPAKLNIVILEGEGATNNIRQRVAREPIVQVEDENRRPLAGVAVAGAVVVVVVVIFFALATSTGAPPFAMRPWMRAEVAGAK